METSVFHWYHFYLSSTACGGKKSVSYCFFQSETSQAFLPLAVPCYVNHDTSIRNWPVGISGSWIPSVWWSTVYTDGVECISLRWWVRGRPCWDGCEVRNGAWSWCVAPPLEKRAGEAWGSAAHPPSLREIPAVQRQTDLRTVQRYINLHWPEDSTEIYYSTLTWGQYWDILTYSDLRTALRYINLHWPDNSTNIY